MAQNVVISWMPGQYMCVHMCVDIFVWIWRVCHADVVADVGNLDVHIHLYTSIPCKLTRINNVTHIYLYVLFTQWVPAPKPSIKARSYVALAHEEYHACVWTTTSPDKVHIQKNQCKDGGSWSTWSDRPAVKPSPNGTLMQERRNRHRWAINTTNGGRGNQRLFQRPQLLRYTQPGNSY